MLSINTKRLHNFLRKINDTCTLFKRSAMAILIRISVTFTCFIMLFACTKKQGGIERPPYHRPDTIKPKDYFPVYPGSFWKYLNKDGDTVRHFTESTYKKHTCNEVDTSVVPFLIDEFGSRPIYGYNEDSEFRPAMNGMRDIRLTPILSENIGFTFPRGGFDSRYGDKRAILTVKEKKLINMDSVIILEGKSDYLNINIVQHYTKNIGLTFSCDVNYVTKDTVKLLRLISFHINK